MRVGRTLPPAAAPLGPGEIVSGFLGIFQGERALDRFRSELKEYFGVKHCFLVSSGKAALTLILQSLQELSPGRDAVIIPAYTCFSVPSSIVRAGLRPRLCDLHSDRLDLDFAQLSSFLSSGAIKRLLAVIPTHLYGYSSDVPSLRRLIRVPGITIIEDAAQAMGEVFEGSKLGTMGDIGFFSLGRGKPFSTVEGGIILTNRDDIADVLNRRVVGLSHYGFWRLTGLISKALVLMLFTHPLVFWIPRSIPFLRLGETLFEPRFPILRMSPFQAGLARNWRRKLTDLRGVRARKVNQWIAFIEARKADGLRSFGSQSTSLLRFPIRVSDSTRRRSLLRESEQRGLGIMPVYPTSISAIPELRGIIEDGSFPVADSLARDLVTLPTHQYVTERDVAELGALVSRAFG